MIQVLALSDIADYASFIWEVISSLVEKLYELIIFIKDLILFIPKIFTIFPDEIILFLIPTITIVVFAFIFKFVK
jgi:hypothetical protein